MEVRQLKHFLAVYEFGSLKRAAEVVYVSQQGISASIRSLETELGVTLFKRARSGSVPTPYGDSLAEHARVICGHVRLARTELEALAGARIGNAVIGFGPFFAKKLISEAILRLNGSHPLIRVRAIEGTTDALVKLLLQGDLDFIVSTPTRSLSFPPGIRQQVLFEDQDTVLVRPGHPLTKKVDRQLEDLVSYPWVVSARYEGDQQELLATFTSRGIDPPANITLTDSATLIHELVSKGDYIHVSARAFMANELSNVDVVDLQIPEISGRRVGVITLRASGKLMPAAQALLDAFLAIWADYAPVRDRIKLGRPKEATGATATG